MPPNIDFGTPIILFDSHPSEQESYLTSYWTSFKSTMKTAFTGDVPKFHNPGTLRVIWFCNDGAKGIKDYELHEYMKVRDSFDSLLELPEVRRVVIMGYSGQNPYVLQGREGGGKWNDKADKLESEMERMKAEAWKAREEQRLTATGKGERERERYREADNSKEGRTGKVLDIEDVINRSDELEVRKLREQEERSWREHKEGDGLLDEFV